MSEANCLAAWIVLRDIGSSCVAAVSEGSALAGTAGRGDIVSSDEAVSEASALAIPKKSCA